MKKFVDKYLDTNKQLKILEVGSLQTSPVNKDMIYKRYFRDNPKWKFVGMDIVAGTNVDIVSKDSYNYPFKDNSFDVVISGNTMEHIQDIYKWIKELERITKDLVCIIVPSTRPEHKYPFDCWRVFPDGMKFIMEEIAGLDVIECKLTGLEDTIGVGKKRLNNI